MPRLLDRINWKSLDQLIALYFKQHLFPPNHQNNEWKGIDGKALRGTLKSGEKEAIIHVTGHDSRTEIAQTRQSGAKSSEIPVVRDLLTEHGLDNQKITLDAHHCNPKTTGQINQSKGIYLTQVKNNQSTLLSQCQALEQNEDALFKSEGHEKAHGRLTSRYASIYPLSSVKLADRWNASGLQTLIVIRRETLEIKGNKRSNSTSYYISNQEVLADDLACSTELVGAIRKHWGVESNNWILDVTFDEDNVKTKASNQAYIMGRLRGLIIQIFRKAKIKNFQSAIEKFCDSIDEMKSILRQVKFL